MGGVRGFKEMNEHAYIRTCCCRSSTESKYGAYRLNLRHVPRRECRYMRTSSTSSAGLSGREGGGGAAEEAVRAILKIRGLRKKPQGPVMLFEGRKYKRHRDRSKAHRRHVRISQAGSPFAILAVERSAKIRRQPGSHRNHHYLSSIG